MTARRVLFLALGVLLVVGGLAGFFVIDGLAADVVCAVAVVVGLVVIRLGSRPRPQQIV